MNRLAQEASEYQSYAVWISNNDYKVNEYIWIPYGLDSEKFTVSQIPQRGIYNRPIKWSIGLQA